MNIEESIALRLVVVIQKGMIFFMLVLGRLRLRRLQGERGGGAVYNRLLWAGLLVKAKKGRGYLSGRGSGFRGRRRRVRVLRADTLARIVVMVVLSRLNVCSICFLGVFLHLVSRPGAGSR